MPLFASVVFRRGYGQWITFLIAVVLAAMPWKTRTWLLWPLGDRSFRTSVMPKPGVAPIKLVFTVDNIKIEILTNSDSARYLGQKITFEDQETEDVKNRLKAAWAAFHKYRQELTSKGYRLCHRLRLFNMLITPTMTYASGTWTLTQKNEKMIKTTQRKMLRLIIQTKRKYKKKRKSSSNKKEGVPSGKKDENNENISDRETEDDMQEDSDKDQDSDVTFQEEADEEKDATDKKKNGLISSNEVPKKQKNT